MAQKSLNEQKEIVLIEGSRKMALVDPEKKMEFAEKAAKILMDTINKTNAIIEIQGNKYLKFEGWQMLASFFGLSVGIEFIAPLENEEGYKAKAVVYTRDGTIIGSAWGICSKKEPGKEKFTFTKLLGTAQTRAGARALRQILGWIAPLGGFKELPAEEAEGIEEIEKIEENNFSENDKMTLEEYAEKAPIPKGYKKIISHYGIDVEDWPEELIEQLPQPGCGEIAYIVYEDKDRMKKYLKIEAVTSKQLKYLNWLKENTNLNIPDPRRKTKDQISNYLTFAFRYCREHGIEVPKNL